MTRLPADGTPTDLRSKTLIQPASSRLFGWSFLLALALFSAAIGTHMTGYRRVLSPGPLASHHASLDATCAACHDDDNSVANIRCERCHDPSGVMRLTHANHVLFGSNSPRLAADAPQGTCTDCHREHLGRAHVVRAVPDGECASCHVNVRSFASHPEFAVVKAGTTSSVGMRLNHKVHIEAAKKNSTSPCETCHESTPDRRGFEPMVFERHCASCHNNDLGGTGELLIDRALLLSADEVRATGLSTSVIVEDAPRPGRSKVTAAIHREPWVMLNALRFRSAFDPEGMALEAAELESRLAYLGQLDAVRPLSLASAADVETAIKTLRQEIVELDKRLTTVASPAQNTGDSLAAIRTIAQQLQGLVPEFDAGLQSLAAGSGAIQTAPAPTTEPRDALYGSRKAELLRLLGAIAERAESTGNQPLVKRAQDLRARVERLAAPASAQQPVEDVPDALLGRLGAIEEILVALRQAPGPIRREDLDAVVFAYQTARQQILGGIAPAEFEGVRGQLIRLLDAMPVAGDASLRVRVGLLRQRVLALRPETSDRSDLARLRADRQRQLDRLLLNEALRGQPGTNITPIRISLADAKDRSDLRVRLEGQLAWLRLAATLPPLAMPAGDARRALQSLLGLPEGLPLESVRAPLCLKCHELDPGGAKLAAVRIAEPVSARAFFSHAPHLTIKTTCATCHQMADTSTLSTDANVPGVASCRTCHKPSEARSACAVCHVYHAPSVARLVR